MQNSNFFRNVFIRIEYPEKQMIKIAIDEMILKIKEKSNLSEQEIIERMDAKVKQLSGLISREGAAHIVANELGIKLFDAFSGKLQIKNIADGLRDVETVGRVQRIFPVTEFNRESGTGKVASMIIADETGSIRIVLWNEQAELSLTAKAGDVVKIKSGYVRKRNEQLEVHLNQRSKFIVNPPDETVPEIVAKTVNASSEVSPVKRISISSAKNGEQCEMMGAAVQVFEPRFYEMCSECRRKLKSNAEGLYCETHGKITSPGYGCIINFILDDGTGTMQIVCFKEQAAELLKMNDEQMLGLKDFPERFEEAKKALLGSHVKIRGKVVENKNFDRTELIAQKADASPDPAEEIALLKTELNR
jgi:replication factor A1